MHFHGLASSPLSLREIKIWKVFVFAEGGKPETSPTYEDRGAIRTQATLVGGQPALKTLRHPRSPTLSCTCIDEVVFFSRFHERVSEFNLLHESTFENVRVSVEMLQIFRVTQNITALLIEAAYDTVMSI